MILTDIGMTKLVY